MAMASLGTHLSLGVLKRNDYNYFDSGVLFDHLADPDYWQMSVVTCTLHGICTDHLNDLIIFGGLIASSLNNYSSSDLWSHLLEEALESMCCMF